MEKKARKKGKTSGKKEEKIGKKVDNTKQLYWIFGTMAFLIVVLLISSSVFQSLNRFEYEGLIFTKERFGEIPVFHHYYFYNYNGQQYKFNLYLRNDPRSNEIPINSEIEYPLGKFAYISTNITGLEECPQTTLAVATLSAFLTNNQIIHKGATFNREEAASLDVEYVDCGTYTDRTTILIQDGSETKIEQKTEMCHVITVSNCQILLAIEKFEVKSILDARERARIEKS